MKCKATHPEVCDTGTQIASDVGSIANSPNGRHDLRPSRAFQPPGRTIPEGNAYPSPGLPSGALATPGPRPKRRFIPEGNAYGGPCFDSARENDAPSWPHHASGRTRSAAPRKHPAPGLCNPFRIESCLGPVTRGSHVPWQPRARVYKSFRLDPAPNVFCWAKPSFVSLVSSTTRSRLQPHGLRPTVVEVTKH
jgi:hypothetical protein